MSLSFKYRVVTLVSTLGRRNLKNEVEKSLDSSRPIDQRLSEMTRHKYSQSPLLFLTGIVRQVRCTLSRHDIISPRKLASAVTPDSNLSAIVNTIPTAEIPLAWNQQDVANIWSTLFRSVS